MLESLGTSSLWLRGYCKVKTVVQEIITGKRSCLSLWSPHLPFQILSSCSDVSFGVSDLLQYLVTGRIEKSPVLEPFHCGSCRSLLPFPPVQAQVGSREHDCSTGKGLPGLELGTESTGCSSLWNTGILGALSDVYRP